MINPFWFQSLIDTWKNGVEVVYSAASDLGNSKEIYI